MNNQTQTNSNSMIAWVALIIAVIALILGWTAYNRSGADLEAQIERQVDEALVEVNQELDEAEREVRDETAETLNEGAQELNEEAQDARTDEQ